MKSAEVLGGSLIIARSFSNADGVLMALASGLGSDIAEMLCDCTCAQSPAAVKYVENALQNVELEARPLAGSGAELHKLRLRFGSLIASVVECRCDDYRLLTENEVVLVEVCRRWWY